MTRYYRCMTSDYSDISEGDVIIGRNLCYFIKRRGFKKEYFKEIPPYPSSKEILSALYFNTNTEEVIKTLELWKDYK